MAALAATSAFAQSSVTVYGTLDAAYKNYTLKNAQGDVVIKSNGVSDGTNAGPRLGFKGTEDLGNGTAANFVFEAGMTVADPAGLSNRSGAGGAQVYGIGNSGNLAEGAYSAGSNTRQAYVSAAKAGVGELRIGYQYTALYDTSTNSGFLVGMEQAGGILHTMSNAEFGGTRANGLVYVSPKIAGTTEIRAYYGAGTGRETNESDLSTGEVGYKVNNAKRQGLAAVFEQGPLRLGAAYTTYKVEQTLGATPADTQNAYGVKTAATKAQSFESKLTQLNASYDFGMVKPVVQYIKGEKDLTAQAGNTTANGLITGAVGKYDYTATTYGATVPFGAATFFVMGGNGKITSDTATLNKYKQTQYGVRYALSKRSTAYIAAGNSKDTQAATTAFGKNSFSAIGLTHSF
ncbi:hypothetical protein B9Z36_10370 [Limnohabitans sp. Rim8]|uniref:porin n=1 Tax=Limnohabitans sp. Rim8 TaxID=1100718 RepID=UPI000D3565D3|nr:porin [Limnohabitans sp. Rim8]PUE56687.1 hypothetical protein B9Z36_10370 [Limnohabitans sp. Rim8]